MNKYWISMASVSMLLSVFSTAALTQDYPVNYSPQYLNYSQDKPVDYQYPQYYPQYYHYQSTASIQNSAINAYNKRNYVMAVSLLKRAIAQYPNDAGLMAKYGYALMKIRRFGESLEVFEKLASQTTINKYKDYANQVIPKLKKVLAEIESRGKITTESQTPNTPNITFNDNSKPEVPLPEPVESPEPKSSPASGS